MARDEAYERYLTALERRLGGLTEGELIENWSETRQAVADHLESYLRGNTAAIDPEIATALLIALREAQHGHAPELFTLPSKRGRKPEPLAVVACKEAAVRYIRTARAAREMTLASTEGQPECAWVQNAKVDQAPVETVTRAFDVSRDAVEHWMNDARFEDIQAPSSLSEAQLDRVTRAMRASGRQYATRGGSGLKAIEKRAGKKMPR